MARPAASDNVMRTWRFLRSKGLTPAQAAGVIGSMQGESGQNLDPAAENPGPAHALGIAQWLGGRKTAAVQTRELGPQLNHLWHELQTSERGALSAIRRARTPEQAAIAWQREFERGAPFEQRYNVRAKNARKVFNRLGGIPGAGEGSGSAGTRGSGGSTRTTTTVTPGVDNSQARAALVQQFLSNKNSDILDFALQARNLQDVPESRQTTTERLPGQGGIGGGPMGSQAGGTLPSRAAARDSAL